MRRSLANANSHGFTLIELIIVMALLSLVFAVAAPRLSEFVKGRDVEEESRRLLALTRYARSEAIHRGKRMELWIDRESGEYGLRPETASEDETQETRFKLAGGLEIEFPGQDETKDKEASETVILFWPDGLIDEEAPEEMTLVESGKERYSIVLSENRLEYTAEAPADE